MLFTSYGFLLAFLPVTLLVYWLLPRGPWRLAFITLASYVFLGLFDWRYVPLMVLSTSVDWVAARALAGTSSQGRRRWLLAAALTVNVAVLGYFKYRGFFLESFNGVAALLGLDEPLPALRVLLPIGISFYTFSAMSYVIDVYRGTIAATPSLLRYSAFIALFPRLTAGPILRYGDVDEQLRRMEPRLTAALAGSGVYFLACGMAKKLLVADLLLPHVDRLFADAGSLGLLAGWAAALGYTLQLYFDFSGYSDMAVGLAFFLGFRFPQNFDSPYKAANPSQFWRRWHMTLSFWLRDYLYIPLGGSRRGLPATVRNLMITFLIAGLWHGAGWTFVVWGGLWGVFQSVHVVARRYGLTPGWTWLNRGLTFVAAVVAWVFFRAPTLGVAGDVLRAMVGLNGVESPQEARAAIGARFALLILAALVWVQTAPNTWDVELRPRVRYALALGLLLGASLPMIGKPNPFLYFQF
jgi:alginate O-acetyltransferase complex protein AlgI